MVQSRIDHPAKRIPRKHTYKAKDQVTRILLKSGVLVEVARVSGVHQILCGKSLKKYLIKVNRVHPTTWGI
jgi:hypothetical protein